MPIDKIQAGPSHQFYLSTTPTPPAAPPTSPSTATPTSTNSAQAGANLAPVSRQLASTQKAVGIFNSLGAATSNHHSLRWASPAGQKELKNAALPVVSHPRDHVWKAPNDAASAPPSAAANAAAPISEELRKFREQLSKIPITFEHTIYGSYSNEGVLTGGHYAGDKNRVRIIELVGKPLPSGIYQAKVQLRRQGKPWAYKTAKDGSNTMFPIDWKPEDIKRKVQSAYNRFCQTAPLNAVKWEGGTEEGIVIRGVIEFGRGVARVSAYPSFKSSRQAGIFGYDPCISDFTSSP